MRTFKSLSAGCLLSLFLVIPALAGDMNGPGKSQIRSGSGSTKLETATCEPVADGTTQLDSGSICVEATPNPFTEAMIIAFEFVTSVY